MYSKVTCCAPINIAVIKYWGKEDEDYNIPLNSSISITLDPKDLCTTTTLVVDRSFNEDKLWLNGREQNIEENKRLQRCLKEVRQTSLKRKHNGDDISTEPFEPVKCHIATKNNFPTAAGLASSASGYACLAKCLGSVYNVRKNLSVIARLGSGSACRSMDGGFVKWEKGVCLYGSDSKARQIASELHWPEMKVIILVVNDQQKSVPSTEGMRRSVKTSDLLKYRTEHCVMERLLKMEKAILDKDFKTFAEITMKDSNQLHAICQDTYPPVIYMNQISHQIVKCTTLYNHNTVKAAYTFDAGSNAVLFTLEENYQELLGTLLKYFPLTDFDSDINLSKSELKDIQVKALTFDGMEITEGGVRRIMCTKPGPGASVTVDVEPLLDDQGYPV